MNGKEDCKVLEKTQLITDLIMLFLHLKAHCFIIFHFIDTIRVMIQTQQPCICNLIEPSKLLTAPGTYQECCPPGRACHSCHTWTL
jgi:hypothetical protein